MIAKIIDIIDSDRETKRYKIVLNNGKTYNFGLKGASTYIDHHDKQKRDSYLKRHLASPLEKNLIINLVPSPALFSAALLLGPNESLDDNIKHLNEVFEKYNINI